MVFHGGKSLNGPLPPRSSAEGYVSLLLTKTTAVSSTSLCARVPKIFSDAIKTPVAYPRCVLNLPQFILSLLQGLSQQFHGVQLAIHFSQVVGDLRALVELLASPVQPVLAFSVQSIVLLVFLGKWCDL